MNESGFLENLVSPLLQTIVWSAVSTTARRSAFLKTLCSPSRMSRSLKSMTSCAMNLLGSFLIRSMRAAFCSASSLLPKTTPYPPASATSFMTSLSKFSRTYSLSSS